MKMRKETLLLLCYSKIRNLKNEKTFTEDISLKNIKMILKFP